MPLSNLITNPNVLASPDGRFLRFADRMMGQVPAMDPATARKIHQPALGRSADAGVDQQVQNQLLQHQAQSAATAANIPFDLFDRQASEDIALGRLGQSLEQSNIGLRNQLVMPAAQSLASLQRNVLGDMLGMVLSPLSGMFGGGGRGGGGGGGQGGGGGGFGGFWPQQNLGRLDLPQAGRPGGGLWALDQFRGPRPAGQFGGGGGGLMGGQMGLGGAGPFGPFG